MNLIYFLFSLYFSVITIKVYIEHNAVQTLHAWFLSDTYRIRKSTWWLICRGLSSHNSSTGIWQWKKCFSFFLCRHHRVFCDSTNSRHIDVEAGLSLMKSTIAESGMGVTSRPYRTKHIEFWKHSMNGTRNSRLWYPRGSHGTIRFFSYKVILVYIVMFMGCLCKKII